MFNKSTVFTTVVLALGLLVRPSVATTPPACVLACLNEQGTLSDIEKLCGSDKVGTCLSSKCGDRLKDAQDHFTNTCKANGHTASLGSSSTKSGSVSSRATSSGPLVTSTSTGGSLTGGSGSGRNGAISTPTTTPSAVAGSSASSLNVIGGALAFMVLTAGFVL